MLVEPVVDALEAPISVSEALVDAIEALVVGLELSPLLFEQLSVAV